MSKVSFVGVSGDEKVQLLGPEFRNIDVLDFDNSEGVMCTRIIIEGRPVTLVGDPQQALKTYLDGQANTTAQ
jgi:hypothetical protein